MHINKSVSKLRILLHPPPITLVITLRIPVIKNLPHSSPLHLLPPRSSATRPPTPLPPPRPSAHSHTRLHSFHAHEPLVGRVRRERAAESGEEDVSVEGEEGARAAAQVVREAACSRASSSRASSSRASSSRVSISLARNLAAVSLASASRACRPRVLASASRALAACTSLALSPPSLAPSLHQLTLHPAPHSSPPRSPPCSPAGSSASGSACTNTSAG